MFKKIKKNLDALKDINKKNEEIIQNVDVEDVTKKMLENVMKLSA